MLDLTLTPNNNRFSGLERFDVPFNDVSTPLEGTRIAPKREVLKESKKTRRQYYDRIVPHRYSSLRDALLHDQPEDEHFASYQIVAPPGAEITDRRAYRINKSAAMSIVELGGRHQQIVFGADFDTKGHQPWGGKRDPSSPKTLRDLHALHAYFTQIVSSVGPESPVYGMIPFTSMKGLRALTTLRTALIIGQGGEDWETTSNLAEAIWRGWRLAVEAELVRLFTEAGHTITDHVETNGNGQVITGKYAQWTAPSGKVYEIPCTPDPACSDWTRLLRLPFTHRDGLPVIEWADRDVLRRRIDDVEAGKLTYDHSQLTPVYKPGRSPEEIAQKRKEREERELARQASVKERKRLRKQNAGLTRTRIVPRDELDSVSEATDWFRDHDTPGYLTRIGYHVGMFRNDKANMRCPNAHRHSDGRGEGDDSSTILYRFTREDGTTAYHIHCAHSSCTPDKGGDPPQLFELFMQRPDLADQYGTIKHEPFATNLVAARHARFRANSVPEDYTAKEVADLDKACAIEWERELAATNARLEQIEQAFHERMLQDQTRAGLLRLAAYSAPPWLAFLENEIEPAGAVRARLRTLAQHAQARMANATATRLYAAASSTKRCRCGFHAVLRGPNGTFSKAHPCATSNYCPWCSMNTAEEVAERVARGGVENLHQFDGGAVIFGHIPLSYRTAETAYEEYEELDRLLKRQATVRGVAFESHYLERPPDEFDATGEPCEYVVARAQYCAIIPAGVNWTLPGPTDYTLEIRNPSPNGTHRADITASPYWLASASIAVWELAHSAPIGPRPWLSTEAAFRAERWLDANWNGTTRRASWRSRRPNRAWSVLFPELPTEYERIASFIDTDGVQKRVEDGELNADDRRAIGDGAVVKLRRHCDSAELNPASSQPVPFASQRNVWVMIELLDRWKAADAEGDREKSELARARYIRAILTEEAGIVEWKGSGNPPPQLE